MNISRVNFSKSSLLVLFSLFISLDSFAQQHFTLSGYVKDKNTGEVLIGAAVYNKSTYKGTVSNAYGFYSLSLPSGKYT
ncbi:MAG TPA: carboxypeptidase-like regulatory domain-containing protein, partial [Salinivirgaceae bacterium]|nr:carboxypeptidase-like regulatory domain-containing protein [Salinivirgaceae bacterium]